MCWLVTFIFYTTTLEEYYVGELFLQKGNGVTDGSVIVLGVYIAMGIYGNGWWLNEVPAWLQVYGLIKTYNDLMVAYTVLNFILMVGSW